MEQSGSFTDLFTVSVALCTYNGAKFIAMQLNSIIEQTQPPDEVVICDDGSTDDTVNIINDIRRDHTMRIRLFVNPVNLGYVKNFGKAVALCEGEIIFLSDQDDVWFPDRIEEMIKPFVESNGTGFVYSDAAIVDESLKPYGVTVFSTRHNARLYKGQDRKTLEVITSPNLKGCLVAFRSNLVSAFLPIPESAKTFGWGHDHWFTVIAHAVTKVYAINRVLMSYRRHMGNCGQDNLSRSPVFAVSNTVARFRSIIKRDGTKTPPEGRTNHLRLVLGRLCEIRDNKSDCLFSEAVLDTYILCCEESIEAIECRWRLQQLNVWRRLPGAFRLLRKGWYSKHYSGILSLVRDILFE